MWRSRRRAGGEARRGLGGWWCERGAGVSVCERVSVCVCVCVCV